MRISVVAQVDSARRNLKQYQKKHLPAAITRALNKTLTGTVVDTKELISKRINLTKRDIGGKITRRPASAKAGYNRYVAVMAIDKEKKSNLASFKGTKELKGRKGSRGGGLSGKPWKKRTKYKHGFIWTRGKKGSDGMARTAFLRETEGGKRVSRLPIRPIFGDSVSGVFLQRPKQGRSIKKILRPKIRSRFGIELGRQLARIK